MRPVCDACFVTLLSTLRHASRLQNRKVRYYEVPLRQADTLEQGNCPNQAQAYRFDQELGRSYHNAEHKEANCFIYGRFIFVDIVADVSNQCIGG